MDNIRFLLALAAALVALGLSSCQACRPTPQASEPAPEMRVRIFSAVELTSGLTSGGRIKLNETLSDEDNRLFAAWDEEDDDRPSDSEVAALVRHICCVTGGASAWRVPARIRRQGAHTIVARNTGEVLDQVGKVVDDWLEARAGAHGDDP